MSLRMTNPPQFFGERNESMNFAHCLHIELIIGKYTDVFRRIFFWCMGGGPGLGVTWENLSMEEFSLPWEKGIFHEGVPDFPALFIKDQKLN